MRCKVFHKETTKSGERFKSHRSAAPTAAKIIRFPRMGYDFQLPFSKFYYIEEARYGDSTREGVCYLKNTAVLYLF